jgi:hypothetical protein
MVSKIKVKTIPTVVRIEIEAKVPNNILISVSTKRLKDRFGSHRSDDAVDTNVEEPDFMGGMHEKTILRPTSSQTNEEQKEGSTIVSARAIAPPSPCFLLLPQ